MCSFSTKRALLKAPNDQDLYKKGAQDMVCMLLNLGADLMQNPYLNRKERPGKRSLNKTHIEMKGGSNNILCMFLGYVQFLDKIFI
ncbi:hypothetical protein [Bacillus cereus]|uniref:hypothetical protein n=1 Tax=Bacillus cereus TaxID=1396 RepID=UPI0020CF236F|nr:hypothetical protein [Bacillus cereus]